MEPVTTRRTYLRAMGGGGAVGMSWRGHRRRGTKPLTLAGSMSLTGPYRDLGRLYRDAYRLTVKHINRTGGVEAGDGNTYRFNLRLHDDKSDPARSETIYERLVDRQGVDFLLGPYSSEVTLAASAVAERLGRPLVQGSGASPEISAGDPEWTFGLLPTADRYARSTVDMAAAQDDPPESAALLTELDTFSQSVAAGARPALDAAGIDLVVDETFPSETTDLSSLLGQVRDAGAEMLLLSAHEEHAVVMANQLESQTVNPKLVMATVGSLTPTFREQTGANRDYVCGPSPWNDTQNFEDPVYGTTDGFVEAIERRYDYRPEYHSAAAAAVVETYADSVRRADDLTPTSVRDAVRATDFTTAYGPISFGERGVIDRELVVYQWQPQNGSSAARLVWPESVREAPPVYPMPTWAER